MFAGINDGGRLAARRAAAVENQINTGSNASCTAPAVSMVARMSDSHSFQSAGRCG